MGDTNNELSYPWHGFLPVFLCHDSRVRRRGGLISFLCLIIADIIILKFAPVETHNRPLEDEEKVKYRRKAILRTVSINAVAILFFVSFPSLTDEISYVFMAVCYAAAFLVAGLHGDLSRARGL